MKVWVGTSGYDFDDWVPAFYPDDLPAEQRLAHYAASFDTVEINNTFYRNPKSAVVASWAEQVSAPFRFVLKASRRVTHRNPLTDLDTLGFLWRSARHLGEHLGPILLQTTPYFRRDVERLRRFLGGVPEGMRCVFELRHWEWRDESALDVLREHGAAWCVRDQPRARAKDVVSTADWGYVRLHRPSYTDEELADWAAKIRAQDWREVFVFFKHDFDTAGPEMAQRFATAFGA